MLLYQDLVPFRLFERVESFAVQVLHQLDFQHLAVIERAHDGWDRVESGIAAGTPAPLAGDDFKSLRVFATDLWPHDIGSITWTALMFSANSLSAAAS